MTTEKQMHDVLQDFLKTCEIHPEHQETTDNILPRTKVKIDFFGTLNRKDFIIECKKYAHPYFIAEALGCNSDSGESFCGNLTG
jgi:ribosomal protein L31